MLISQSHWKHERTENRAPFQFTNPTVAVKHTNYSTIKISYTNDANVCVNFWVYILLFIKSSVRKMYRGCKESKTVLLHSPIAWKSVRKLEWLYLSANCEPLQDY